MITHNTFYEILRGKSLVVYYVYEVPFGKILEEKRFYWHNARCEESIGPFNSLTECLADHVETFKSERALQKARRVQELQRTQGGS